MAPRPRMHVLSHTVVLPPLIRRLRLLLPALAIDAGSGGGWSEGERVEGEATPERWTIVWHIGQTQIDPTLQFA
jgi:hypothetical protein